MRRLWRPLLAGVLGSLILLAIWFRPGPPPPAWAQGVGIFSRTLCTSLTSPVVGQTFCFEGTTNTLKVWNGTTWVAGAGTSAALGIVNVKDLGAKGDGVTDDTTAIQNAINSVSPAGTGVGGIVWFPPAIYITTTTLTMKDHVRLLGPLGPLGERTGQTGRGAVIKNTTANNTITFATTGDASLSTTIEGLSFEGTGGTGAHIDMPAGSNRITVQNNSF